MTEKEQKFYNDVNALVLRAFRAGAHIDSVETVLKKVLTDLNDTKPYLKAILERDLAP